MTGTLHEDQYTYSSISRSVLPTMAKVSDKSWGENQNKHFVCVFFFNRAVYEIMWKKIW